MTMLLLLGSFFVVLAAVGLAGVAIEVRKKNLQYWLPAYCRSLARRDVAPASATRHIFLAVCDHWEPQWNNPTRETSLERVDRWVSEYPRRYQEFRDSDGRPPQHTFFMPQDEYQPEYLDRIARLCREGFGDVEVHLHHDNDTADQLAAKLDEFRRTLYHRHGLLRKDPRTGEIVYGFIHGNWALCNSRPDGRWCGVDQELTVLRDTGCYADFTMPSAPSPTQTRRINSIYYAKDIPGRRKSHDFGIEAEAGRRRPEDHLLMVQGPLTLDWKIRKWGVFPRIENGDIIAGRPMSMERMHQWIRSAVHVRGRPDWLFVKLHTHGCKDGNIDAWLGPDMQQFHRDLRSFAQQQPGTRYHYVTAWEMAQLVHQAEEGAATPIIGASEARALN